MGSTSTTYILWHKIPGSMLWVPVGKPHKYFSWKKAKERIEKEEGRNPENDYRIEKLITSFEDVYVSKGEDHGNDQTVA